MSKSLDDNQSRSYRADIKELVRKIDESKNRHRQLLKKHEKTKKNNRNLLKKNDLLIRQNAKLRLQNQQKIEKILGLKQDKKSIRASYIRRIKGLEGQRHKLQRQLRKHKVARANWNEWDWFRANYHLFSFDDKKLFYRMWYSKYPQQQSFLTDVAFFIRSLRGIISDLGTEKLKIAELGGREGYLALKSLEELPKIDWVNMEIREHTIRNGLQNLSYREHLLSNEIWLEAPDLSEIHAFVSSNVIEHISNAEAISLFKYLDQQQVPYLILRICTSPKGQKWRGDGSSHVLTMGTIKLTKMLRKSYTLIHEEPYVNVKWAWCSFWKRKE
jgi:hypothetical protein